MFLEYTEQAVEQANINSEDQVTGNDTFVLLGISKVGEGNRALTISPKAFKRSASIQGERGFQGIKGDTGERGPQGLRGYPGTASITENDYQAIMEYLDNHGYMPLGTMTIYAGYWDGVGTPVPNCLPCDGRKIWLGEDNFTNPNAPIYHVSEAFYRKMGWSTTSGVTHNMPDLLDRFIKGSKTIGTRGGYNSRIISGNQLPQHNHEIWDLMYSPDKLDSINTDNPSVKVVNMNPGKRSDSQGGTKTVNPTIAFHHYTEYAGGAEPWDNQPAFYSAMYIMRVI